MKKTVSITIRVVKQLNNIHDIVWSYFSMYLIPTMSVTIGIGKVQNLALTLALPLMTLTLSSVR